MDLKTQRTTVTVAGTYANEQERQKAEAKGGGVRKDTLRIQDT